MLALVFFELPAFSFNLDSLLTKINSSKDTLTLDNAIDYTRKFSLSNTKEVEIVLKEIFLISEKNKFYNQQIRALIAQGIIENRKSDFILAIKYMEQAKELSLKQNKTKHLSSIYNNLGIYYHQITNTAKAFEYFYQSLLIKEKAKDSLGVFKTKLNISNIYLDQGFYDKAESLLKELLEYTQKTRDTSGMTTILQLQGKKFLLCDQFNQAIECFQKSISLSESPDTRDLNYAYYSLLVIYTELKNFTKATYYLNKILPYYTQIEDYFWLTVIETDHAKLEYNKKNYGKSIQLLDLASSYYKKYGGYSPDRLTNIYQLYYLSYKKLEKHDLSLEYYEKYSQLNDSIYRKSTDQKILGLQVQYESAEKENKIKILETEKELKNAQLEKNKQTRKFIILGITILFIILFFLYNRYKSEQKLKAENEILELEQRLLLSQMNPHFIFNSLNSIRNFVLNNESLTAGEFLNDFAKLMRLILDSSQKKFISISAEIKILSYYLKLEQLRLQNSFDYYIHIDKDLENDLEFLNIPSLILQPFIENAVIHGISPLIERKGKVEIRFKAKNDFIEIEIEDNGVGRKKTKSETRSHAPVGIRITEERFKLIEKNISKKINYAIYDLFDQNNNTSGTLVKITIPEIVT